MKQRGYYDFNLTGFIMLGYSTPLVDYKNESTQ